MRIKDNSRSLPLFHALVPYKLMGTSQIVVFMLFLVEGLQVLSLLPLPNNLGTSAHEFLFDTLKVIGGRGTSLSRNVQMGILTWILLKGILILIIGAKLVKDNARSHQDNTPLQDAKETKSRKIVQILMLVNAVELATLYAIVVRIVVVNARDANIFELVFGIFCFGILWLEIYLEMILLYDFKYSCTYKLQGASYTFRAARFIIVIPIVIITEFTDEQLFWRISGYLILFGYGLFLMLDNIREQHFLRNGTMKHIHQLFCTFYATEGLLLIGTNLISSEHYKISLDLMLSVLFLPIYQLLNSYFKNRLNAVSLLFLYDIYSERIAVIYISYIAILFKWFNLKRNRFYLVSSLNLHFKKCQKVGCLCYLLKIPTSTAVKDNKFRSIDGIGVGGRDNRKEPISVKMIYYHDDSFMQTLFQEKTGRYFRDFNSYKSDSDLTFNFRSKDVPLVLNSFYHYSLTSIIGSRFRLMCSYISYLLEETQNYVGVMVYLFSYMYSRDFQLEKSNHKILLIRNYLDIALSFTQVGMKESRYFFSSVDITRILSFHQKVEEIENLIKKSAKLNIDYFTKLQDGNREINEFSKVGGDILNLRRKVKANFNELFRQDESDLKLNKLFIAYRRYFYFDNSQLLEKYYKRISNASIKPPGARTMYELSSGESQINLLDSSHLTLFLKIKIDAFLISKFSKKLPEYFEYTESEVQGQSINVLLPKKLAAVHDSFVINFLNQKKNRSIYKNGAIESFGITKSGKFKIVLAFTKLECLLADDVYVGGLIIEHPMNKHAVVLAEPDGKIVSLNEQAEDFLGGDVKQNPHSLFLTIPILMKYFFPDASKILKYQEIQERFRADRKIADELLQKDLGVNYLSYFEDFEAFFFSFFLDNWSSIRDQNKLADVFDSEKKREKLKGVRDWGLIKNNSMLKLPSYFEIMSEIFQKNRNLIIKNIKASMRVKARIGTFQYKMGIIYKLIEFYSPAKLSKEVIRFFKASIKKLKTDMFDIMIISPCEINNLYRFLKLETMIGSKLNLESSLNDLSLSRASEINRKRSNMPIINSNEQIEEDIFVEEESERIFIQYDFEATCMKKVTEDSGDSFDNNSINRNRNGPGLHLPRLGDSTIINFTKQRDRCDESSNFESLLAIEEIPLQDETALKTSAIIDKLKVKSQLNQMRKKEKQTTVLVSRISGNSEDFLSIYNEEDRFSRMNSASPNIIRNDIKRLTKARNKLMKASAGQSAFGKILNDAPVDLLDTLKDASKTIEDDAGSKKSSKSLKSLIENEPELIDDGPKLHISREASSKKEDIIEMNNNILQKASSKGSSSVRMNHLSSSIVHKNIRKVSRSMISGFLEMIPILAIMLFVAFTFYFKFISTAKLSSLCDRIQQLGEAQNIIFGWAGATKEIAKLNFLQIHEDEIQFYFDLMKGKALKVRNGILCQNGCRIEELDLVTLYTEVQLEFNYILNFIEKDINRTEETEHVWDNLSKLNIALYIKAQEAKAGILQEFGSLKSLKLWSLALAILYTILSGLLLIGMMIRIHSSIRQFEEILKEIRKDKLPFYIDRLKFFLVQFEQIYYMNESARHKEKTFASQSTYLKKYGTKKVQNGKKIISGGKPTNSPNYGSFINIKLGIFILSFILILNAPVVIDFILISSTISTFEGYYVSFDISMGIASGSLQLYANSYMNIQSMLSGDVQSHSSIVYDISSNYFAHSEELRTSLNLDPALEKLISGEICMEQTLSNNSIEKCKTLETEGLIYTPFLALTTIKSTLQTLDLNLKDFDRGKMEKTLKLLDLGHVDELLYYDSRYFSFIAKNSLDLLQEKSHYLDEEESLIIYFGVPTIVVLYLLIYWRVWGIIKEHSIKKTEAAFLVLPSVLIMDNPILIHYFKLKDGGVGYA